MKKAILIPAYNPQENLCQLVDELSRKSADTAIVVVDDGSNSSCRPIFEKLKNSTGPVIVIHHPQNRGKGQALKTAMDHALRVYPQLEALVTADADGQHRVEDILKVLQATGVRELVLGVRRFDGASVPWKSRAGNMISRYLFFIFTGLRLGDTQTGLRGFSPLLARQFLAIKTSAYDFELDMLFFCKLHDLPLRAVEIETVYIDQNRHSHFNPLQDSFKIAAVFCRFIFVLSWTSAGQALARSFKMQ